MKELFGTLTELELEILDRCQPESGGMLPLHSTGFHAVKTFNSRSPVIYTEVELEFLGDDSLSLEVWYLHTCQVLMLERNPNLTSLVDDAELETGTSYEMES